MYKFQRILHFQFEYIITFSRYTDPEAFRQAKIILYEIGHFLQVQDDYLDCYGDPNVTGKVGTDIQDGKCTWFALMCMQRANVNEKELMREFYGSNNPEHVQKIKELYNDLRLLEMYKQYEKNTYDMINTLIQQTAREVLRDLFLHIMNSIYLRDA